MKRPRPKSGSSILHAGDVLLTGEETSAHFYSAASGPDDWEFVVPGESFMIMQLLLKSHEGGEWKSALCLSNDGIVVVLSWPHLHNFRII